MRLYEDAIQLKKDRRWGYKRISKWLTNLYRLHVPPSTVHSWISGRQTPVGNRNVFKSDPSYDLSYVAGAVKGDGSVYRSAIHHNDEIKLAVVDCDFSLAFAECLSKIFPSHQPFSYSVTKDDGYVRYVARVGSHLLADFLSQPLDKLNDSILPYPEAFLRGLFDAEGSVIVSNSGRRLSVRIELANNDLAIVGYAYSSYMISKSNLRLGNTTVRSL
jgi:intein-encoded DNA endonuclease-like protein